MKGLIYQLKSVRKDKFCIMSFLLPVVAAIVLNISGSVDLSSLGEYILACLPTTLPQNWKAGWSGMVLSQSGRQGKN